MHVYLNNKAFTLIEFLVAIVIMMVGLLGLLQAVNVSLSHNRQNQLRNEAVSVADAYMAQELTKGFEAVSTSQKNYTQVEQIPWRTLNAMQNYSATRTGSSYQNSKEVRYQIIWRYKGVRYTHETASVLSKAQQ